MPGIRGFTGLDGNILITYPRDDARGLLLHRRVVLGESASLSFEVAAEPRRAWKLCVYVGNTRVFEKVIEGGEAEREWTPIRAERGDFSGKETTLRLYQRVLLPGLDLVPGKAFWKGIELR